MNRAQMLVAAAGLVAALAPDTALAQAASEEVKRMCRSTTTQVASMIEAAKRRGLKDLESGVTKPSDNWGEQVAMYMIQAANRSDSLSQSELASLGYAYCVELAPRGDEPSGRSGFPGCELFLIQPGVAPRPGVYTGGKADSREDRGVKPDEWSFLDSTWRWASFATDASWAQAAGRVAIERLQGDRLSRLLGWTSRHSRYYAGRWGKLPHRDLRLTDLPHERKADLMAHFDAWVTDPAVTLKGVERFVADLARIGQPFLGKYAVFRARARPARPDSTSTTCGALAVYDALAAVRFGGHFLSGSRVALVAATEGHFAGVATWERLRQTYPALRDRARVFPVTAPIPELVAALERFKPDCIASYPTTLRALAEEKLAGRTALEPSGMWSGGETCSASTREVVERAFGCPIADDYGCSEFMNMAHPCARGALHVNADWVLLEPVDEKRRPVAPGTPSASVLLTNLANRVQPLIRYDLGDSITLGAARCSCGSPFPTVRVEGRSDEILRLTESRGRDVDDADGHGHRDRGGPEGTASRWRRPARGAQECAWSRPRGCATGRPA